MTATELTQIKRDSDCNGNEKDNCEKQPAERERERERERRGGGGGIVPMPLLGADG